MIDGVDVAPMTEDLLLWRCLHGGPLTRDALDRTPEGNEIPWPRYRARNVALLRELTRIYGSCAILARDGEKVVGSLRFYPRAVLDLTSSGHSCLQQDEPHGPADDLAAAPFPSFDDLDEKTLVVHCLQTGNPAWKENPYQRQGLGTRLCEVLIAWARDRGWGGIEADAFEDLPLIYRFTGAVGHRFWRRLGFREVLREPHPDLEVMDGFTEGLEKEARSLGLDPARAKDRIRMRLEL